ncbi:Non-heme dioxygenase N-terminal domain-containing protein [Artemisia annua]|uniref:Non-heme dioxygenase N-terminal domain-containing protein n=1 Tax=Artemisia annua TaxID=35608 RepID=A0A2U1N0V5_ARTAN|nr:Non-heme dioxygenase N-terminal domain-containing protein [Artemisia annua]
MKTTNKKSKLGSGDGEFRSDAEITNFDDRRYQGRITTDESRSMHTEATNLSNTQWVLGFQIAVNGPSPAADQHSETDIYVCAGEYFTIKPDWEAVPEMCRQSLKDWDKAVVSLGDDFMSILCEGLGVKSDKLKELTCLEGRVSVSHYYPQCPQPELTLGITPHTDPGVLTVLVQNKVGGLLQVKYGEDWAAVEAVPGAILFQS